MVESSGWTRGLADETGFPLVFIVDDYLLRVLERLPHFVISERPLAYWGPRGRFCEDHQVNQN
jgi:hypothetical protein